jgi:hypothetical protein
VEKDLNTITITRTRCFYHQVEQAEAKAEFTYILIWQIFHGITIKKSDSDLVSVSRLTFWDRTGKVFSGKKAKAAGMAWSWAAGCIFLT